MIAISETSNSCPRTIRRNAWMMAGTSSKVKVHVRGTIVPFLSGSVWP